MFIEDGILGRLPASVFSGATSAAVISDDRVSRLYAKKVCGRISKIVEKCHLITFPHGERSKSLHTSSVIASKLSGFGADRRTVIVALGGGVVGDLSGFVASIFKRGVRYIQAPTTLLSQVDSSIGGKTAVDTEWGKNQLGTFYQPVAVFIDPSKLDTLPSTEVINGLGEMVKSGIIADRELFDSIFKMDSFTIQKLKTLIVPTCKIKLDVVQADERETNLRSVLNYGHTVGHAIEASSAYRLNHGKSVVLGMIAEGWISHRLGIFHEADYERQRELLLRILGSFGISAQFESKKILSFAKMDKKTFGGSIRMSLPERIGRMHSESDGSHTVPIQRELLLASIRQLEKEVSQAIA